MAKKADDFDQLVIDLLRPHVPDLDTSRIRTRASRNGRYLSITVTIWATSRAQLDSIYHDLSAHERIVMAL